jgi:hypothetical protein
VGFAIAADSHKKEKSTPKPPKHASVGRAAPLPTTKSTTTTTATTITTTTKITTTTTATTTTRRPTETATRLPPTTISNA